MDILESSGQPLLIKLLLAHDGNPIPDDLSRRGWNGGTATRDLGGESASKKNKDE